MIIHTMLEKLHCYGTISIKNGIATFIAYESKLPLIVKEIPVSSILQIIEE